MRLSLTLAIVLFVSSPAFAGRPLPPELEGVRFEPILKEQLPLDAPLRDDKGQSVTLSTYCDGGSKPVVLAFVQYRCPMLCNLVLEGLVESLRQLARTRGFQAGEHFHVVVISFDHREKTDLAAAKKAACVEGYGIPGSADGWHFLTADEDAIRQLTDKAGFRFRYDAATDQYAHDSGILILTPKGRISRYFFGIDYAPADLYFGLVEASAYRIGQPLADRAALLFCYSYDPVKGTYQFTVMNMVRWAGVVTVLGLVGFFIVMIRREKQPAVLPVQEVGHAPGSV